MTLSPAACHQTLRDAHVAFETRPHRSYPQVEQPIVLTGPIAGVTFTIPWSRDPEHDPHMVWDCRLAVAMIPVARFLAHRGVTGVDYVSVLRRGGSSRSRHRVGLAMDLVALRRGDERARVQETYERGSLRRCAESLSSGSPQGAALLRDLTCELWRVGTFHTILTPDYDRAHHDHLHLDLKPDRGDPPDPYVGFSGSGIGQPHPRS